MNQKIYDNNVFKDIVKIIIIPLLIASIISILTYNFLHLLEGFNFILFMFWAGLYGENMDVVYIAHYVISLIMGAIAFLVVRKLMNRFILE